MPSTGYTNSYRSLREIDELEQRLLDLEGRMTQLNHSHDSLNRKFLELNELKHVLRETGHFFSEVSLHLDFDWSNSSPL